MSVVTNIMLTGHPGGLLLGMEGCSEPDNYLVPALNKYLQTHHKRRLLEIGDNAGGDKGMEAYIWAAAINYLNSDEFVALYRTFMKQRREYERDTVQLFMKEQDALRWSEISVI